MNLILGTAALGAALVASGAALAADPPDRVGTWKAVPGTYASARLGGSNDYHPDYDKPNFGKPDQVWSIVIEAQEGRSFAGKSISPGGKAEPIVGVVSFDGQRVTLAAMIGALFGNISGDQIEFCFQDQEDNRAGVACYVTEKQ